jgi:hypothetical protein
MEGAAGQGTAILRIIPMYGEPCKGGFA